MYEELIATGIARFEFVHFPNHGRNADLAHQFADCAADQGRFWQFHDEYMAGNRALYELEAAADFARRLGMDIDQFRTCAADESRLEAIVARQRQAIESGIRTTPTLTVDGRVVAASAGAVIAAAEAAAE